MREFVINRLNDFFKINGFKKKGSAIWYFEQNSICVLCEYQGSRISKSFYLNFGLFFPKIKSDKANKIPKSYDWHFNGRYNQILAGYVAEPDGIFNLDCSIEDLSIKMDELENNIKSFIIPFFKEMIEDKYFENNFPKNFPHDKLWIQNIREKDFINFINS